MSRDPLDAGAVPAPEVDWRAFSEVFDYYASGDHGVRLVEFYFWIVDQLESRDLEPTAIAEIGCGTGLHAERLVEWYPDATLDLVDKFAPMLNRARERLGDLPQVTVYEVAGEAYLAEREPESLDLAVFCRSFYTLSDPVQAARDLVRALRPGGCALIYDFTSTIDVESLDERLMADDPERWPVCRAAMVEFNQGVEAGRYHLFDEAGWRELWSAAGAEVAAYECFEPDAPNQRLCVVKAA